MDYSVTSILTSNASKETSIDSKYKGNGKLSDILNQSTKLLSICLDSSEGENRLLLLSLDKRFTTITNLAYTVWTMWTLLKFCNDTLVKCLYEQLKDVQKYSHFQRQT